MSCERKSSPQATRYRVASSTWREASSAREMGSLWALKDLGIPLFSVSMRHFISSTSCTQAACQCEQCLYVLDDA